MTPLPRFFSTLAASLLTLSPLHAADSLEALFANPPAGAHPHTWWHWNNGNVTKEGITLDLEAMKRIGVTGAQIFNVKQCDLTGPVVVGSPEWLALTRHAIKEADRLGMELTMHNCPGWSESGGPWIAPEQSMQKVVWTETQVKGGTPFAGAVAQPETVQGFYRDIALFALPASAAIEFTGTRIPNCEAKAGFRVDQNQQFSEKPFSPEACIDRSKIIDLTAKLKPGGKLNWVVPPGNWTLLRIGHTSTGKTNAPAADSAQGLECDKMSRAAVERNFEGMMGKVIADVGPLAGKSFKMVLADSWEAGCQNWTPMMRDEFTKRRGYDPLPWLPCIAGHVVGTLEESERFLWDFRKTIGDLIAENHYGTFQELCHKHGMLFTAEAPGIGMPTIADQLQCKARTDVPMGEFWIDGHNDSREPACAAHIGGQQIATAEAFTAVTKDAKWTKAPFDHKALGDLNFSRGINRFVFHRYAMQPWKDRVPGMTMGPWGTNFERTNTWWEQAAPWMQYLSRSQALLQSGLFQADVLYFYGEGAPVTLTGHEPKIPAGYDYDAIDAGALLKNLAVTDGRLTLPSGMSYRVLLLPPTDRITLPVLRKIKALAQAGATILGGRPAKSPSLTGYPACDLEIASIASELWGDGTEASGSRPVGKGRVVWGKPLAELLAESGAKPDFESARPGAKCVWIHRRTGDSDIYFVANQSAGSQLVPCTFRVAGKTPELWHPDSGKIEAAPAFDEMDGRTTVPIQLDPAGSVFVVFRKPSGKVDAVISATRDGSAIEETRSKTGLAIDKAVYGANPETGDACMDVTARLRAAVADGRLKVKADNSLADSDPAFNRVKKMAVEYSFEPSAGKATGRIHKSITVEENALLELPAPADQADTGLSMPMLELSRDANGKLLAGVTEPGDYEAKTRFGKTLKATVEEVHCTLEIDGAWQLQFPPKWGAPEHVTLGKLISWTEHSDDGVRHFSGAATYRKEFDWGHNLAQTRYFLDLGSVKELAQVVLNGKDLGVLWKPPFRVEITDALKPGKNSLEIRVTNLWPNRLIGDAALPEDKRVTWTTFQPYKPDDALLPSGLLGPVKIDPQVWAEMR